MANTITAVQYVCDWRDENKVVCGKTEEFSGREHEKGSRDGGWGAYANAHIRWDRWNAGNLWFCPTHAEVFGNNHGWGQLESYKPPVRRPRPWWKKLLQ